MSLENQGMRFPPRKTSSNKNCCALGCKSYAKKNCDLRFHMLPKANNVYVEITNKLNIKEKLDRRQVWVRRLKINENLSQLFVCSRHFTKDDYCELVEGLKNRILKPTAVPSVNLPTDTPASLEKKQKVLIRDERTEKRINRKRLHEKEQVNDNKRRLDNDSVILGKECKNSVLKPPSVSSVHLPTDTPESLDRKENGLIEDESTEKRIYKRRLSDEEQVIDNKRRVDNDSIILGKQCKTTVFKQTSVPSINLSTATPSLLFSIKDERTEKRITDNERRLDDDSVSIDCLINEVAVKQENRVVPNFDQLEFISIPNYISEQKYVINKSVQVEFENYTEFIKNEKDLNAMTGLSSFSLLHLLENIVIKVVPNICYGLCKQSSQLSIKDRIVLTFIKLKQNISYALLSALFRINNEGTCRTIFLRIIDILAAGLQFAISWPSKEEVSRNLPKCFVDFTNVRAVIDRIEINIEKPQKGCCQVDAYSVNKLTYAFKFITAVSPAGIVTFISKAYPGQCSDKFIFEKSNLINMLETNDGLMTDKGFLIDDVCLSHGIQLVRPNFSRGQKKCSNEEALLNAEIAKARVYVKRSHQRLMVFKILSTNVSSYLVSRLEQIFTIICAIVNLSAPILKDDEVIQ